jgi:hypothetical protein
MSNDHFLVSVAKDKLKNERRESTKSEGNPIFFHGTTTSALMPRYEKENNVRNLRDPEVVKQTLHVTRPRDNGKQLTSGEANDHLRLIQRPVYRLGQKWVNQEQPPLVPSKAATVYNVLSVHSVRS